MSKQSDEIAALRREIAELKASLPAKPAPFQPDPNYRPVNPIDRLSMPASVVREMAAAVPDAMLRAIVRDNQAPSGPSQAGAIPSSQTVSQCSWHRLVEGNPNRPTTGPALHQSTTRRAGCQGPRRAHHSGGAAQDVRAEAMTDEPETSEPETSEQRSARRLQLEYQELELPHVRAQLQIDRWIESERALQAELDDWVEVAGFRERRTRYGFTKHWRDSDFDMR